MVHGWVYAGLKILITIILCFITSGIDMFTATCE
jgi:hypothetical protein